MKPKAYFPPVLKLICAAVVAFIVLTAAVPPLRGAGGAFDLLSPVTRAELNRARGATVRYHNIDNALADGYLDINVFFPNMGYHFLKPDLLDGTFEADQPELLVYADFGNGQLRLVAVEYAVPIALSETAPEGFTGAGDAWHRNETFGLWTLHAWIWYNNADGVFAAFNERVP